MSGLRTSTGAPFARLLSVAGARGGRVVTNDEMCTLIDSTPEWIEQRTGITERRWLSEGETPLSLAVAASREAIARSGLDGNQVDAVICATVSHFRQTPSLATYLARDLGLTSPVAFDLSAACAGFSHALAQAEAMVRCGSARHVLVVGVEAISLMTDLEDRSTAFLFSDGAGAAIVGPSETPAIGPVVWGSDPQSVEVISSGDWLADEEQWLRMDGAKVFRWATTFIADQCRRTLDAAGITADDLDVFVPHQANNRITDSMLRHLGLPERVVVARDIVRMGNSSAASVPLAVDQLLTSGQATSGQTALLIGFGAGLVYAGQVVVLP